LSTYWKKIHIQLITDRRFSGLLLSVSPHLALNLLVLCFEVTVTMTVANLSSPIDGTGRISVYASVVTMWVVVQ
jgi:hypothetical protein